MDIIVLTNLNGVFVKPKGCVSLTKSEIVFLHRKAFFAMKILIAVLVNRGFQEMEQFVKV